MDSQAGQVEYAIVSLIPDNRVVAIPWNALKPNRESGMITLGVTGSELTQYLTGEDAKRLSPPLQEVIKEVEGERHSQPRVLEGSERPSSSGMPGPREPETMLPNEPRRPPRTPGGEGLR